MLSKFIRDKRVICSLGLMLMWGISRGISYINQQQQQPEKPVYSLQTESKINANIPLLLSLGADDKIAACHSREAGNIPEKKLDMEGRKVFFTEKGWKEYQEFATRIKQKLARRKGSTAMGGVRLQEFLGGKTYNEVIYHLDIQLTNGSCDGAGINDFDLYLTLVSDKGGPKIDGWKVKSYPFALDASMSY